MLRLLNHRVPLFLTIPFILVSVFFLFTYQTLQSDDTRSCELKSHLVQPVQPASAVDHGTKPVDPRCAAFPDAGTLQITIKTGATEAYAKLLPQLMTSLSCSKRVEIFSDLEETIGGYHVHDALKDFDAEMKLNDPDFEIYRTQQEYFATGQDISELGKKHKAVWTLDKYKFMHMVQKTWDLNPGLDWYFFIEADTYVIWSNLNIWLERLDPKEKLFLGSEAEVGGEKYFAHGGSGFLLSGTLLKLFAGNDAQMASRNDKILPGMCCGDLVLARAIRKYVGVEVQNNWPWLNGETPWTIPFGPDYWCKPIITMHHVSPRQRAIIYDFEQKRKNPNDPILFHELSELSFPPGSVKVKEDDWDNFSEVMVDEPSGKGHTLETCQRACNFRDECWQYRYSDGECHIGVKGFRLGEKKLSVAGRRWISGWKAEKIDAYRRDIVCKEPEWRTDDYAVHGSTF